VDNAEHTLLWYPTWDVPRTNFCETIDRDLSLPVVANAISNDKVAWTVYSEFCAVVMRSKEDAERACQAEPDPLFHRFGIAFSYINKFNFAKYISFIFQLLLLDVSS